MLTAKLRLASVLALSLLALGGLLLLSNPPGDSQAAGLLYVAPDGSDTLTCSSYAQRCRSIQHAVDVASGGDEIRIAAGTYISLSIRPHADVTTTGVVTQVAYISKTISLRGGYNANFSSWNPAVYQTILDAKGKGRGLYITGNITPTIEGLHITGGDASGMSGYDYVGEHDVGGGVYVIAAAATLKGNWIFSNTAPYGGGGVFVGYSTAWLSGNAIFSNTVATGGGGLLLYQSGATLSANTIASNTSDNLGGGLYLFDSSSATLESNTISSNKANSLGGGLDVASCNPTLSGNIFSHNTAPKGGGLYLWYSRSLLTNNVIVDNTAGTAGSGLWTGGSYPRLLHTTIARNTGGNGSGVYATEASAGQYSGLTLINTILVSQTVGITATTGSTATLDGVLWYGNTANTGGTVTVTHATIGNPAFAPDGYHLTAASSAIDHGVASGVTTDLDGDPRFNPPDLGADEWVRKVYLSLVLKQ